LGARAASTACCRTWTSDERRRAPRGAQDVQAVHRWPVPALGVRALVRGPRCGRHSPRQCGAGLPQGPPGFRPGGTGRVPRLGGTDRHEPRPDPVPRGRAPRGPPIAARGTRSRPRRTARRARGAEVSVDRSIRPARVVRGWADKISRRWAPSTRRASYFDFSIPEPTGVVGVVAPEASSLLGLVSRLAPVIVSGNTAVVLASETAAAARRDAHRDPGHLGRPGRCHQPAHGPARRAGAVARGSQWTSTPSTLGASHRTCVWALETSAVENMKRIARPPRGGLDGFDWLDDARAQRPEYIAAFLEVKTVWHPIGM